MARVQVELCFVYRDMNGSEAYELKFVDADGRSGDRVWLDPDGSMRVADAADEFENGRNGS